jgi:gliding motility-associated-like protein
LEAGESAHFTPYIAYPNAQYSWDFGDGSTMETTGGAPVTHSFETAGSPIVQLSVDQGLCTDSTWLSLCVEDLIGGSVSMPTAFTPLAGGGSTSGGHIGQYDVRDNDLFAPVIRGDVLAYDFSVYNRWGEMIFHTSDPEIGWNGHYQGQLCKQDVYVWKVAAVFYDASSVEYAGDVTLIRR